jgi:hypothetical protein
MRPKHVAWLSGIKDCLFGMYFYHPLTRQPQNAANNALQMMEQVVL